MGNATLLDVFQAAAGLTNQGLDIYSRQKKAELDAIYFEQSVALQETIDRLETDFKAIDLEGGNAFQTDPSLYRNHVNKTLQQWRENALKSGNQSKYYNDLISRTDMKAHAEMEQRVHQHEVNAGIQRANVAFQKAYTAELQRPLDPDRPLIEQLEEKKNTFLALNDTFARVNGLDIYQRKEADDKSYNDFYSAVLSNNLQNTVEADRVYVETVQSFMPQDLPGRDDKASEAIKTRRNMIWMNNENVLLAADGDYNSLIQQSVKNGMVINREKYNQAMALYNQFVPIRDGIYINGQIDPNYNPEHADRLTQTFKKVHLDGDAGTRGSGSGGGGSVDWTVPYDVVENIITKAYADQLNGNLVDEKGTHISFMEWLRGPAIATVSATLAQPGYRDIKKPDDMTWNAFAENVLTRYYTQIQDTILKLPKSQAIMAEFPNVANAVERAQNNLKGVVGFDKLSDDEKENALRQFTFILADSMMTQRGDAEAIVRNIDSTSASITAQSINAIRNVNQTIGNKNRAVQLYNVFTRADALSSGQKNRTRVITNIQTKDGLIDVNTQFKNWETAQITQFSTATGINKENITVVPPSEEAGGDIGLGTVMKDMSTGIQYRWVPNAKGDNMVLQVRRGSSWVPMTNTYKDSFDRETTRDVAWNTVPVQTAPRNPFPNTPTAPTENRALYSTFSGKRYLIVKPNGDAAKDGFYFEEIRGGGRTYYAEKPIPGWKPSTPAAPGRNRTSR
jgi:hypothetical protein